MTTGVFEITDGKDDPDNGWYFWDETQAHMIGPFSSSWEAEKRLTAYIMYLDGQHPIQKPAESTVVKEIRSGRSQEELVTSLLEVCDAAGHKVDTVPLQDGSIRCIITGFFGE